jgi:hypothetical protein
MNTLHYPQIRRSFSTALLALVIAWHSECRYRNEDYTYVLKFFFLFGQYFAFSD